MGLCIDMFNPKDIELEVLEFWEKKKIYSKSVLKNKNGKEFYFIDGPPYTTGAIHVGHAWNKALKDCLLRYKRMRGFKVGDKPGFDMHGLPIEVQVEKKFGIKNKQEIIDNFGLNKFIKECEDFAIENMHPMIKDFKRIGVWLDWENPYMTIKNNYIEGAWSALKKAKENDYLYKGEKAMTWCARCATALAKHELDYEDVTDDSIFLKFKLVGKQNEYLVIWTTTPWTIPYNMAVMVNPLVDYVKARVGDEIWIMAKVLIGPFINLVAGKKYEILEELKGSSLEGLSYEHPLKKELPVFEEFSSIKKLHTVVLSSEYVDTTSGSGLVHCAPGCGTEDYEVGKANGIPPFNEIDENGIFSSRMGAFAGYVARKDDKKFIEIYNKKGFLIESTKVEHSYAHCWRCKNGVVYKTTEQWFLAVSRLSKEMRDLNSKTLWVPDWAGSKQFDSWLENLQDWCISRQRFWGIPLPIWECEKCDRFILIENGNELEKLSGKKLDNLHRPYVDDVTIKCSCSYLMHRIPDVLDVWMDSGAAPWAAIGKMDFVSLDFILEGKDQIRGWFNSLICLSMVAFGKSSYKSVYMHGMIMDSKGRKMSKSLKNIISPYEVIDECGADTMRYYMIGGAKPGLDMNYNFSDMNVKLRNLGVLWNLHKFLIEYSKLNGFGAGIKGSLQIEEEYMYSYLNRTVGEVTHLFDEYRLNEIPEKVENLFLELSRTYVQLVREKSVVGSLNQKKIVFRTLYDIIFCSLKMLAPIVPFTSEKIYLNLKEHFDLKEESVHLCDWVEYDESLVNEELESKFSAMKIVMQSILAGREKVGLGIRWPLASVEVFVNNNSFVDALETLGNLIKTQTNVKELKIVGYEGDISLKVDGIQFSGGAVYLDSDLSEELKKEGYARELIRFVQSERKKANLTKDQMISLSVNCNVDLSSFDDEIKLKCGVSDLVFGNVKGNHTSSTKVKNEEFKIGF